MYDDDIPVNCKAIITLQTYKINEPWHDKTNKMSVCPAKTQISLGIRPVWSESSLFAWRKFESLATHWVHSEDSDQTGRMPRLIWVFAGRTLILLVLSQGGSNIVVFQISQNKSKKIWACPRQNDLCTQRRLRSAWASAQSDQSSLSAWRSIGYLATHRVHSKDSD